MEECFDLKKNIKNLNNQIENDTNNLKLEYYQNIKILEDKINQIKYDTKDYYFDKLNYIFSDIKNSLISKGYLDFINNPNINFINLSQNFSNKLLIDSKKILDNNFFDILIDKILEYENSLFLDLLEELEDNILFIFHINYDFIEKGIINFNSNLKDTYLFYHKIIEFDGIIEGTLTDPFNYISNKIDSISNIKKLYQKFSEIEIDFKIEINKLINKINELNILAKDISLPVLIKDTQMNFLKNCENNLSDLSSTIEMFIYKNNLNENLNERNKIIEKINFLSFKKNDLTNKIENIAKKNQTYSKQNNILKLKNYKIRELSNICINQKKNSIEDEYDFNSQYQDDLNISAKKNIIKIKKINSEIKIIKSKKNKIIAKLNQLSSGLKDNILRKRYNSIINNFQIEIDNLDKKKHNLQNENIKVNKLSSITIIENNKEINSEVNINSIKEIVESTKLDKKTQQNLIQMYIDDNNIFISENKEDLIVVEKDIQLENKKLSDIERKNKEIFRNYDYLVKQKQKTTLARDLFRKIEYIKKELFTNRNEFNEKLAEFISSYSEIIDIKNNSNNSFIDKLNNSIINVLRIQEIINIFSQYSPDKLGDKYELYYLKILSIIKKMRKEFKRNKIIIPVVSELNKINHKIINNDINLKFNNKLGTDLEKMIFILE